MIGLALVCSVPTGCIGCRFWMYGLVDFCALLSPLIGCMICGFLAGGMTLWFFMPSVTSMLWIGLLMYRLLLLSGCHAYPFVECQWFMLITDSWTQSFQAQERDC